MKKANQIMKSFILLFLLTTCLSTFSCKDDENTPDTPPKEKEYVELDRESMTLEINKQVLIIPNFSTEAVAEKDFVWRTDQPEIIKIKVNKDKSSHITALKLGTASVTIEDTEQSISATCQITVVERGDGVIRILGIGNSFTENAVNNYLCELANADGQEIVVARLTIGGATLDEHLYNAQADKAYSYTKTNQNGQLAGAGSKTLANGIADEEWDYIFFQQQSWLAGQYRSYEAYIPQLVEFAKSKSSNPNAVYSILQTWAFAYNYGYDDFEYYKNSQLVMLDSLVDVTERASQLVNPKLMIIPAGTTIQNGRTSLIGNNFCAADGYHLNGNIGAFTAACALYEAVSGRSIIDNSFKPGNISEDHVRIIKNAAHYAAIKPKEVTDMAGF